MFVKGSKLRRWGWVLKVDGNLDSKGFEGKEASMGMVAVTV